MTAEIPPPASGPAGPEVVACFTKCYPCLFGQHADPPAWHTWANDDDIEHAKKTGQPDPRTSGCGCWCARPTA